MEEIKITTKIERKHKVEIARLYFQAFTKKFHYLWLFTKKEEEAAFVLEKSINYQKGLYAIKDDEVMGFVGLETGNEFYAPLKYSSFVEVFGKIGASWRYIAYGIYRLFHGEKRKEAIHIDPIVVSGQSRGMGIGTKLLEAVFEFAKKKKVDKVILEVVDTNPKAKKLYEKMGFCVVKEEKIPFFLQKAGFQKVLHMEKIVV